MKPRYQAMKHCSWVIKIMKKKQELLFAKELETDNRGASIFTAVEQFFKEHDIPMKNIIACATDGPPALT